jgi:hypothetical protein
MLCIKQNQYGNMIKIALRVISIGILFSAPEELNASEKLYVFYPSATRPHIIFEKLQSSMKDVRVFVFGNASDFLARVSMEPPDAILTKTAIIHQLNNYSIVFRGARGENTEERYVLVSMKNSNHSPAIDSESVVGTVDFLGRTGMINFVREIFPVMPRIKRVNKPEDLIPLLIFEMADFVLTEESKVEFLKTLTNRPLEVTPLSAGKQGIVALAVFKGKKGTAVINGLKSLQSETKQLFGIDKWK